MTTARGSGGSRIHVVDEADAAVQIRHLTTHHERDQCMQLQRSIWGDDYQDVVPASLISAGQKAGGLAAGAFMGRDLVGFVYGLPAVRAGRMTHWSHMLGVAQGHRRHGLGKRLKYFQRDWVLSQGITEIHWTFDPLIAGNAHFNLNILGVRIDEYVTDMYADTGSALHAFGTDRLVAHWDLDPAKGAASAGGLHGVDWERTPDLMCDAIGLGPERPAPAALRVSIPPDILALARETPHAGTEWRRGTRAAFRMAWECGYRIVGFSRAPNGTCHYLLRRGEGEGLRRGARSERDSPAPWSVPPQGST